MTKPISVLSRAERGSKLKEPMKMDEPSIEKVFACKLEAELPLLPSGVRTSRTGRADAARFISNSFTPAASKGLRRLA